MRKTYDTMILGCGEAGVFAGYELIRRNPGMKVLIVDQGQDIYHRSCPIVAGKVRECIDARSATPCAASAGPGRSPDGKYNFTTAFGGWLTDFMPGRRSWSSSTTWMRSTPPTGPPGGLFHGDPRRPGPAEKGPGI